MTVETAKKTLKVLLADDHAILRSGLKLLLSAQPDLEVVGEATNGKEAVAMVKDLRPDLVIMDVAMPEMNGLAATDAIKKQSPEVKVLLLSMHENEEYLYRAIEAGGSGYVLKKSASEELIDAIRQVMEGQTFIRSSELKAVAADFLDRVKTGETHDTYEELTEREKEVLGHIAEGFTNQQIADKLIISVRTVETHRARIMDKLGLHKRSELVQYAKRKGLILD